MEFLSSSYRFRRPRDSFCQWRSVFLFLSFSLSSLKVRTCLVENKADRDVKPGDFRTPVFTVLFFRHYERIPRWIFTSGPRGSKILRRLHPTPDSILRRFHPWKKKKKKSHRSWHLLLSFDPSTRPFLLFQSLPAFRLSFLLVFLLSLTFFLFFIFFDFFPLTRHFPSALSVFLFFFPFFYYSCLWFLVSPSEREEKRKRDLEVFPSSREGDVFHRRCVAGVSLLFLVLLDGFFNFISFNWTQLKFVASKSFKEILERKNNIPNETIDI